MGSDEEVVRDPGEQVRLVGRQGWWTVTKVFVAVGSEERVYAVQKGDSTVELVFASDIMTFAVRMREDKANFRQVRVRPGHALPNEIIDDIRAARSDAQLNVVMLAGRLAGWTLEELAVPLGVTRERARQRAAVADAAQAEARSQRYPRAGRVIKADVKRRAEVRKRTRINGFKLDDAVLNVPVDTLTELSRLAESATSVRVYTPIDAPERLDIEPYKRLLIETLDEFSVPVKSLERALGYRTNTIKTWLGRHGHGNLPPSQPAFQGVHASQVARQKGPARRQIFIGAHCRRGHLITEENMVMNGSIGYICGTCRAERKEAAAERRRAASLER